MTANQSRIINKKNIGKFLAITVIVIVFLVGIDYTIYKSGGRSHLYGTLNNYNQNQLLKFDELNLNITNVAVKSYPKPAPPTQTDCAPLYVQQPPIAGVYFTLGAGGAAYQKCNQKLDDYNRTLKHYSDYDNLIVDYAYANVANKPLNLAQYKVKLLANTPLGEFANLNYDEFRKPCAGLPATSLLKSSPLSGCFTSDIPKSYNGPLTLSVVKDGKEKDISIMLPNPQ